MAARLYLSSALLARFDGNANLPCACVLKPHRFKATYSR